jgi:hypothetical protein
MFILIFGISMALGAVVIDYGLWASERRGGQKDADLSSLAGARELAVTNADSTDAAEAEQAASDYVDLNDIGNSSLDPESADPIVVDDSCFAEFETPGSRFEDRRGVPDSVRVDVDRESAPLFFQFFNIPAPDIGARAKACAGAAVAPSNLIPIEVDNDTAPCFDADETPNFAELCPLEFGAKAENPRGVIDLGVDDCESGDPFDCVSDGCSEAGGDGNLEPYLQWGAVGNCQINVDPELDCDPVQNGPWYDCVAVQTGNAKNIADGIEARISREGLCDEDGDGIDEFDESVDIIDDTGDPSTSLYAPKDCDPATPGKQISPRLVTIVVIDEDPIPGNDGYGIVAFAGFRIVGCASDKKDLNGDGVVSEEDMDEKCDVGNQPPGHLVVYGEFVNLIYEDVGVGPVAPGTGAFGVSLIE